MPAPQILKISTAPNGNDLVVETTKGTPIALIYLAPGVNGAKITQRRAAAALAALQAA